MQAQDRLGIFSPEPLRPKENLIEQKRAGKRCKPSGNGLRFVIGSDAFRVPLTRAESFAEMEPKGLSGRPATGQVHHIARRTVCSFS